MTSREEGFAAWLAMNDYLVEDDFPVFDVDDLPDDPFTEEGLRVAEAAALDYFADKHAVLAPENRRTGEEWTFVYRNMRKRIDALLG